MSPFGRAAQRMVALDAASKRIRKRRCLLVKKAMLLPRQRGKPRCLVTEVATRRSSFRAPSARKARRSCCLNYSFGSTLFQWVELNSDPNATNLIGTGDDWANPIDLGSNSINFYGTTYSDLAGLAASGPAPTA